MNQQQALFNSSLLDLANTLNKAKYGTKESIKEDFAERNGMSVKVVARRLRKLGYTKGRKRRADAGKSALDRDVLEAGAAMLELGIRKNGKATAHVPLVTSVLKQNGHDISVCNATFSAQLRKHAMHQKALSAPEKAVSMKSDYPNQVHQVDPSLCLLYYTPNGKQNVLHDDEIYKNKPDWVEKIGNLKCWRYVLTDHFSSSIIVKYYQAKGESQENLYDFLLYCWKQLKGRPFHGVPDIMIWDLGSANTSQAIKNALESLNIEQRPHAQGNAKAKGQVENANNIVETHFESLLKYEPVRNIDELNIVAERWYNAWNANAIPFYDSRLKRDGFKQPQIRYDLWHKILESQLRELPDLEVCRYLLVKDPVTRKVNNKMEITFRHPVSKRSEVYSVADLDIVFVGAMVTVTPLVMDGTKVIISAQDYKGEEFSVVCEAICFDEDSGFRIDAGSFIDGFNGLPDNQVDKNRKLTDRVAYGELSQADMKKAKRRNDVPFNGEMKTLSHIHNTESKEYMPRKGEQIDVPNRVQIELKPMDEIEIRMALKAKFNLKLNNDQITQINGWYPDGVVEDDIEVLGKRLTTMPALRVVGEE